MAYNKAFNPDSLPAFAEPERKSTQSPSIQNSIQSPVHSQAQQAMYNAQYEKRPSPVQTAHPNDRRPDGRRLSPQMHPPANYGVSPPNRGYASPPPGQFQAGRVAPQTRPAQFSRPTHSPAPPGADPQLWPLFQAVDKDRTGALTEKELRAALVNGDWSAFDPYTVKMMIRMFDTDRSNTINFEEFCGLWGFLASWRSLFDRFDKDRSGNISLDEYSEALVAFGYRLSESFVATLFKAYDKRREGAISFDLFVQSCISLKRMTDVFKRYDDDRDGYITLSFEDFLLEIIRQKY
ncbi:hypothetical protein MFRU_005g03870 [Monilinia fructicola]|uniref:EF-hand domain-containing protein n=1 Tax=Monilinia fructicola TaxID=38448 RepID=A0A5M9JPG7_MONFR|nr:hypothetical protein EYC84_002607 [Monilinia fructicola]KAG4033379.1 hypothetical protein MFRU_005g03870 [Monilinia fructicola]